MTHILEEMETERQTATVRFRGTAFGSFDGVLELADFRGRIWKGALKLTAGNKEIECTIDALAVPEIKGALKCRVVAYGLAHYNGRSGLPDRLDVVSAKPIPAPDVSDLGRWRGAFELTADESVRAGRIAFFPSDGNPDDARLIAAAAEAAALAAIAKAEGST
jgi:hypothetical protein